MIRLPAEFALLCSTVQQIAPRRLAYFPRHGRPDDGHGLLLLVELPDDPLPELERLRPRFFFFFFFLELFLGDRERCEELPFLAFLSFLLFLPLPFFLLELLEDEDDEDELDFFPLSSSLEFSPSELSSRFMSADTLQGSCSLQFLAMAVEIHS